MFWNNYIESPTIYTMQIVACVICKTANLLNAYICIVRTIYMFYAPGAVK